MLHAAEVLPGARRSLRRVVSLDCQLFAPSWEAPRRHRIVDLSPAGVGLLAAGLLPLDEGVVISFTPPGWWVHGELTALARVARAEPRSGPRSARMGLELLDLAPGAGAELARVLRGRPPPLPSRAPRLRRELVWIDVLCTFEEDLGDRVNVIEVSEALGVIDEVELEPRALAPLLTGSAAPYHWRCAA